MRHYAQTHLQLYRQLQDASYGAEDLLLVDRAYRFAMRLFAGHYRPNHKPFLMHLVGVAGILAATRQPGYVVAAGLLHSAYSLGLGRDGCQVKRQDRQELAASVGENAERLIYAYSARHWSVTDLDGLADRFESLSLQSRQVHLMKLADIHEEFLDAGHDFQPQKKLLWDEDKNEFWLRDLAGLIEKLGHEQWAEDFRQAVGTGQRDLPDVVRGRSRSSYILAPGFRRSPWKDRVVRWLSRH